MTNQEYLTRIIELDRQATEAKLLKKAMAEKLAARIKDKFLEKRKDKYVTRHGRSYKVVFAKTVVSFGEDAFTLVAYLLRDGGYKPTKKEASLLKELNRWTSAWNHWTERDASPGVICSILEQLSETKNSPAILVAFEYDFFEKNAGERLDCHEWALNG